MARVFNHYISSRKAGLFFVESVAMGLACLVGACLAALPGLRAGGSLAQVVPGMRALCLVCVPIMQFAFYLFDLYDLKVAQEDRERGLRILKALGVAAIAVGMAVVVLRLRLPGGMLLCGATGAFLGATLTRTAFHTVVGRPRRVLVIGDGGKAKALIKAIEEGGENVFRVVAQVDPGGASRDKGALAQLAQELRVHDVVVAVDEARGAGTGFVEDLIHCRFQGRGVYDAGGFFERVLRRIPLAHLRGSELAFCDEVRPTLVGTFLKRAFDVAVASVLLLFAAPLMLVIALLVRLDSKGPIFYRQERVGKNGKKYALWKFRSMRTDAEQGGAVWAKANDDRVTRAGRFIRKTRLDELPQVFNVLEGSMSFVGPRPERPIFVEQLKAQIPFYGLREAVKPGITGWAQIRYPYGASVEDARNKLEFDLYYLKNGSLILDLAIIFHTVRHVLLGRGAR
jgi:sugar transferase (PEP-CTERM system associated)